MFRFLIENKLISWNQSGFKPGDSYIKQLLSIIHKSFDDGFEVGGVFLDISKAFDKVEHKTEVDLGLKAVNYYHKALRLGCCSSPRSASARVLSIN